MTCEPKDPRVRPLNARNQEREEQRARSLRGFSDDERKQLLEAEFPKREGFETPSGWRRVDTNVFAGEAYAGAKGTGNEGLLVLLSEDEIDGRKWRHLSTSRRNRIPTYEELARIRRSFFGEDTPAFQVFPAKTEHVNLHHHTLHLWLPIGFDPFPDPKGEHALYVGGVPEAFR